MHLLESTAFSRRTPPSVFPVIVLRKTLSKAKATF